MLERLSLSGNAGVSFAQNFPMLSALTHLDLSQCSLASVPQAVLASMRRLKELSLRECRLTALPEDLGQRLPELREIDLSGNLFETVPCAALAGATSLEWIELSYNDSLKVRDPLDPLLELPRLKFLGLRRCGRAGPWSVGSTINIAKFMADLRVRRPAARFELELVLPSTPRRPAAADAAAVQDAAADAAARELARVAAG